MHLPIFVLVKLGLFLGPVLLLGSGAFARWIGPGLGGARVSRQLGWASLAGLVLILVAGLVDLGLTVSGALGELSPGQFWSYLTQTQHGKATAARIILALALYALGLEPTQATLITVGLAARVAPKASWGRLTDRSLFTALALGLLVSISLTGHAGSEGFGFASVLDALHLIAMTTWVAAVAGVAWLSVWKPPIQSALGALERTSTIGLMAVVALALTGTWAALGRIAAPEVLFGTGYGQVLVVKLALVGVVLVLAGLNRLVVLPHIRRLANKGVHKQEAAKPMMSRLVRVLQLESLVLLAVLGTTSALTNQVPPQRGAGLESTVKFEQRAADLRLNGMFSSGPLGGLRLELRANDGQDRPLRPETAVFAQLVMLDHDMSPLVLRRVSAEPGLFRFEGSFWMDGNWRAEIAVRGTTIKIPLRAR